MIEEWRQVLDYEGLYSVSNYGRVYSHKNHIMLSPRISVKDGKKTYGSVALYKKNIVQKICRKQFKIAELVIEAFIGRRPYGMHIDHIDCNKLNDSINNLEYVSPTENAHRAWRNGCFKRKSRLFAQEVCHL